MKNYFEKGIEKKIIAILMSRALFRNSGDFRKKQKKADTPEVLG
jgi:hypothetical protein